MNDESRPRLVVEATTAEHAKGGIGVVVAGLMGALADSPVPSVEFWLGPSTAAPEGVRVRRVGMAGGSTGRMAFQRLLLPAHRMVRSERTRLLFMDSYLPLWRAPGTSSRPAVFVHDVLPLTHPELFARRRDLFKRLAYSTIRRSRPEAITSCEYTAREVERALGVRPRIATFGCGQITDAEADAFRVDPPAERASFVLYVGNLDKRKGLRALIDAVARVRGADGSGPVLAVVGNWRSEDGLRLRRSLRDWPGAPVRFLGRRPRDEVLQLMRRARALVYPAEAEGFGLPILEGLASRTPVVAADLDVFRSWAGDTIQYARPRDSESLAAAIAEAASDSSAQRVLRGLELASNYRWARFAREVMAPLLG